MNVSAQSIELGHGDSTLALAGFGEGSREFRATLKGIAPLGSFNFDELGDEVEALGLGEPSDCCALRFEAKARLALLCGRHPDVADRRRHGALLHGMCSVVRKHTYTHV